MRPDALSLDGTWEFVPDPERRLAADRLPAGVPVTVPGAWEGQLSEPQGIVHGWYRRPFTVPPTAGHGSLILRFDGALLGVHVWLDGRPIGARDDGSLPFELDAGAAIPGATHELAVEIDNPFNVLTEFPAFDRADWHRRDDLLGGASLERLPGGKQTWYSSTSGLLGSVTAAVAPELRLGSLTVEPDASQAWVRVRWGLAGAAPGADRGTLVLSITGPSGEFVAERAVAAMDGVAEIDLSSVERWDLWHPALYRVQARLGSGHGTDQANARFGFRTVAIRDGFVVLNGRPVYLRGALDQDFWPIGRATPASRQALEQQVRLAREMGLNLLRCHLKVPSADYLDVSDEAGILAWCELPSCDTFDEAVGLRAREQLDGMVDALGHHPSVVAWTIINEDWGTDLRHSARDRRWLAASAEWLRARDPSRLVVDNSACETGEGPNFHLRSDLADFHAYRAGPDGQTRWRTLVDDFASRPAWLWSPFGDASPTGQEPLVMSEFGGWGLPRPSAVQASEGLTPWWWDTGQGVTRPAGLEARFSEQGLDRIWPDVDALAEATQWQQFESLASQVRELRRHPTIGGYVITELSDAFWEPNGLLDVGRGKKVFHERLAEISAPDVLILELPRADFWGGEVVRVPTWLASHPDGAEPPTHRAGRLTWSIRLTDGSETTGSAEIEAWPQPGLSSLGAVDLKVPEVVSALDGELVVEAEGSARRISFRRRIVVVPGAARRSSRPRRLAVIDPVAQWSLESRLRSLGHEPVRSADAEVVVATMLDQALVEAASDGARLVVLARSAGAVDADAGLARTLAVAERRPADVPAADRPWDGDWVSVFAWSLGGIVPGLARGGLLGEAHAEVYPDHVITGLEVGLRADAVSMGMFAGWVHAPASILVTIRNGEGRITLTTLRLAPEAGPVATVLLESIVQTVATVES